VQIRAREGVWEDLCRLIKSRALGLDSFLNEAVHHRVRRIGNQQHEFNTYKDTCPSSDLDRTDRNHPSKPLFQLLIYASILHPTAPELYPNWAGAYGGAAPRLRQRPWPWPRANDVIFSAQVIPRTRKTKFTHKQSR
jgi:hypothetical protein